MGGGHAKALIMSVAVATGALLSAAPALAQPVDTARIAAGDPNDWLTYHGSYKGWDFSGLDQINANNVKDLEVAWTHIPGRSTRGLQSMPLAADGVLYYTGSYSRTFALDGATGKLIWSFLPELDDATVSRQTHSPYTRGLALGEGKAFVGSVDGRLFALDAKTGKLLWETKLIDSAKLTVGFTGAPIYANGTVIIGAQGGEWPYRGPIFGVDAATGKKKWEFDTTSGTDEAKKTWGNDTWRVGGGGGWMPGTYDAATNTVWWGTANPAPLYDWSGPDFMTTGARPGLNLYTTSVIALDPDTGKLKFFHQELPHDTWDFDSAVGEFVSIDRDGKQYMVHPNKSGFIFVYDRVRREGGERLAARAELQLRQGHRPEDGRTDRAARLHRRQAGGRALPAHLRRRQLELGLLQPEHRPLLQDRQGMVHDAGSGEDHAGDRAAGAAQHRRQLHDRQAAERRDLRPSRRSRPDHGRQEVGSPLPRAADWRASCPPRATWCSCRTAAGLCTPITPRPAPNSGTTATASAIRAASSATRLAASSTSLSPPASAAWPATITGANFGEPYKSMPRDEGILVVYSLKQ